MIRLITASDPKLYLYDRSFPEGQLKIPLANKKFTIINYYNNPDKAIPVEDRPHMYYLHPTLPAYLIYYNKHQYVGTYEEIKEFIAKTLNNT